LKADKHIFSEMGVVKQRPSYGATGFLNLALKIRAFVLSNLTALLANYQINFCSLWSRRPALIRVHPCSRLPNTLMSSNFLLSSGVPIHLRYEIRIDCNFCATVTSNRLLNINKQSDVFMSIDSRAKNIKEEGTIFRVAICGTVLHICFVIRLITELLYMTKPTPSNSNMLRYIACDLRRFKSVLIKDGSRIC